ncbi:MAG: nuclear transport factor 2 family protein [Pseudomonadota bacterium]
MPKPALALALMLLTLSPSLAAEDSALADIESVVQKYLDGTRYGDKALVEEAFLPSLEVQWLGEGDVLQRRPGPDYIERIAEGVEVPRYGRIVSIDATEKSAMVKAEIKWNDRLYTDYMLLLKVEGEWRIANKIATWTED